MLRLESHECPNIGSLHAAWVIYDGDQKRVLAARDAAGGADMHWGTTDDGRFIFGSDPIDLAACNPTATPFPAGSQPSHEPHSLHSPENAGGITCRLQHSVLKDTVNSPTRL